MNQYQSFKFIDNNTNKLIEHTCNPNAISVRSKVNENPYFFNLVFFNKEVFSKYKINREKYEMENSFIKGKGWILRYELSDNNEQVIVLLRDLLFLPPTEQIYWKSFNEIPNSNIPQKMIKNYVYGKWVDDTIGNIRTKLRELPKCKIDNKEYEIWREPKINNQHNFDNLDYVLIGSKTEWEDEIQTLHLNVIDGFDKKTINLISKKMKCYNEKYQSLKQLNNCLIHLEEIPKKEVEQIMNPLFKINNYRSKVISHTTEENYPEENLQYHFKELISELNISITFLFNIIKKGLFNFDNEK